MRIVDISKALRCGEEISCEIPAELPVYMGYECEEYRFELRSHVGCYFETPGHLFRGGEMTCDVPVERLFMPALVVRLDAGRDGAIEADEIEGALHQEVRPGDALIVDTQGQAARYFSRACGAWMVARKVALVAATLAKYDTGFANPTGVFIEWFEAGIPILAEIENLERIAHERVLLILMPMKIERVCTAPCRAVVLDGEAGEVEGVESLLGAR